jgi:hypothetical protein
LHHAAILEKKACFRNADPRLGQRLDIVVCCIGGNIAGLKGS